MLRIEVAEVRLALDKSRIPPDKLNDPRLVRCEETLLAEMRNQQYLLQVCVHEAAHAIYMERLGLMPVLHGPVAYYDADKDTFDFGALAVHGNAGDGVEVTSIGMARWYVAGGVATSLLIGSGADQATDGQDFEVFISELVKLGANDEAIAQHWEQAKRDVEKDMRSPVFRREVWDRARDFKGQLEGMFNSDVSANKEEGD
jgi:hypothetical protein